MTSPDDKNRPTPGSSNSFKAPEGLDTGMILGVLALGLLAFAVSNAGLEWTWKYWGNSDGTFDRSVIFRNFGVLILALIALPLALWRSWTAHKQAKIAESGLIIDRYQKGAQMLESGELSVRIAGVYALRELALSDPEETYFLVLDILYAFVREKSKDRKPRVKWTGTGTGKTDYGDVPADLQSAMTATSTIRGASVSVAPESRRDWRANLSEANLSGANLVEVNLSGADLYRANLSDANLLEAYLNDAILREANLSDAFLYRANLSGANLYGANLSEADLWDANLTGARFREANLSGAKLYRANLSDADLWDANLTGARFKEANLSGAKLYRANLSGAFLEEANLSDADLSEANLTGARFGEAKLSGANLYRANLSGAKLRDATLSGAILGEANLSGANLTRSIVDDQTHILDCWAFKNSPPLALPELLKEAIAYRDPEEPWDDFFERMQSERPDLGR